MPHSANASPASPEASLPLLLSELQRVLGAIDPNQLGTATSLLSSAPRIFFAGAGRSRLSLAMAAMRLMHLGLQVHVAGEVTTPALAAGDLLVIASASGTTQSALQAAETAQKVEAKLLVITTAPQSPIAKLAETVIVLPAAAKSDTGERASQQYAGSLFEQAVLLLFDAIFHSLWKDSGKSAEGLLTRHANLE